METFIPGYRARLRKLLEARIFLPVRWYVVWREALAEERFVKKTARSYGIKTVDFDYLKGKLAGKGQKVFYVLGSGSSVEEVSSESFETISREVSVGINAWALHDFIPDIYAFEPVPERDSDHYSTMKLLDREDVQRRKPTILFLKPRDRVEMEQLRMVPVALQSETLLYGRFQPYTREPANLAGDMKIVWKLASRKLSVLPDSGASIVRMAFLGLLLGFSKIVFVGVDLNHTEYFWEKNPWYLEKFGRSAFSSGQKQSTHETLTTDNRAFSVVDMVVALHKVAQERGVSVEVVSARSLLADYLPLHEFDSPDAAPPDQDLTS
jgi:hypothetical protein